MATVDNFIIKAKENKNSIHEKGLGWHVFECMSKNKDLIAQICTESGVKETFGDVLQRAIRTALELKRRGVTSADIISTCTFNHFNSCVPILASLFLNCASASIDPTISLSDTVHLLNETKPKIIFIDHNSEELIARAQKIVDFEFAIVSFEQRENFIWFGNFIKPSENINEEEEFRPTIAEDLRETIIIFFSSGTTGLPKATCLNHYAMMKKYKLNEYYDLNILSLILCFSNNHWFSSFNYLYLSVQGGVPRLIVNKYDPRLVWNIVEIYKPTFLYCTPYQLSEILDLLPQEGKSNSFKLIIASGQKLNPNLLSFARKKMPNTILINPYGTTEASGLVLCPEISEKGLKKINSSGTVVSGISYKIIDMDTGKLCGPNEKGELFLKSDFLMNGYFNRDSSFAFSEDGWLKTGDVVYYDEDLYFYIVDRTKEIFKYKGWHLTPAKLEEVLCSHPDVLDAVVFGIPQLVNGDHACGIVKLKKGTFVTVEKLKKFADERLDEKEKLRGGVHVIEEFPLTPSGKVNRRRIKEIFVPV